MRERSLIVNDAPVERRLLDHTERGFGYEPGLALLDESGHVRALADIEAEAIRFAISHYGGQMAEGAPPVHNRRPPPFPQPRSLRLAAANSEAERRTLSYSILF